MTDACGLGCDQGLEIDDVEQGGFNQLRVQNGALNPEQRLMREDRAAFGDGVNIQSESKVGEIAQEILAK